MRVLEKKGIKELGGSEGVGVPDAAALERIQQRWSSLHEAYSPNKKVHILLKVCKSIYQSMSANATSGTSSLAAFGPEPGVDGGCNCGFLPFLPCRYRVWR